MRVLRWSLKVKGTFQCNLLERSLQQPVIKQFCPSLWAARGRRRTIDPINRDLCALPSPLRPSVRPCVRRRRRRRRGAGRTDGRTAEKFSHPTMRRRCRVRVVVGWLLALSSRMRSRFHSRSWPSVASRRRRRRRRRRR